MPWPVAPFFARHASDPHNESINCAVEIRVCHITLQVVSRQSRSAHVYEVGIASIQYLSGLLLLVLVAKELP